MQKGLGTKENNSMDGDFVKRLILFDPDIPCTECLIRPVCTTPCNNLYVKTRSWAISKHNKYLEWMFGRKL